MTQRDKKFLARLEEYIAGFIRHRYKETGQYVTRDEIAKALLADPQIQTLLQTQYQNSRHDLPWHAGNLVDWFSANLKREVSAYVGEFERVKVNKKWAYRPAPATKDLTIQELVRVLQDGRRTAGSRIITKAFLQKVADQLAQEVGTLEADVGTQAGPASSTIQFIDRAYFFLDAAQRQHSLFPRLAVFVLPGRIWWGLYAWGGKEDAQVALETLQALDLLGEREVHGQIDDGSGQTGWTSGVDIYAGRALSTEEVSTYSDVDSLVSEIAIDMADWRRRAQPQLPALYARLQPYLAKEMSNRTNDQADSDNAQPVNSSESITTVYEVLYPGEQALVLFTRGDQTVINPDGSGRTGNWKVKPQAVPKTIVLYLRESDRNQIYVAERGKIEGPFEGERYNLNLKNVRQVGTTPSNWFEFTGMRSNNPVVYVQQEGRPLAEPFATIFHYYEAADAAFDVIAETVERLGASGPQDERFALTLTAKNKVLRLSFAQWMIVDFQENSIQLALLSERVEGKFEYLTRGEPFRKGQQEVRVYMFPYPTLVDETAGEAFDLAYEASLAYIRSLFDSWQGTPFRHAHRQELFEAVFDPEKRALLLTGDEPLVLVDEEEDEVTATELEMILPPPTPYTDTDFLKKTYMEPQQMQALVAMLQDKQQLILYGPPGTGKTYVAQELGRLLTGLAEPSPTRLGIVQFHPAYGYEDFMEGIRPESIPAGNGHFTVTYPVRSGIFRRFCEQAQKIDGPCILIIDEINRGNMARIFGELMFLLEYRDKAVTLPYSGVSFHVPDNVYLIGTMNTADRSIALVDFALRRRFHFYRLGADPNLLKRWLDEHQAVHSAVPYLAPLYRQLAGAIEDKDYAIGHSHFMKPNLDEQKLERIWHYSIMPYLEEYYLDQPTQAGRWQWDGENVRPLRESHG